MKQRPIFILLTFFISIVSVVLITFVFLRTQLSEQKLQKIVVDALEKNFPEFHVELDNIGLSLGTKFRYKINNVAIKYRESNGVFAALDLKNVSVKFPLFFLIGKQDIDVSVEEVNIEGFNYDVFSNNNFKITSLNISELKLPAFVLENRVNVTLNDINFTNTKKRSMVPFDFSKIDHLVMKDVSFAGKTAMELAGSIEYLHHADPNLNSLFRLVILGHFNLGQLFSQRESEYKLLIEVKEADNPFWGWINNHRIQVQKQSDQVKSSFEVYGNSLEGTGLINLSPKTLTMSELNLRLRPLEITRESSTLKSILHLISKTLSMENIHDLDASLKGEVSFIKLDNQDDFVVLSHLSSIWSKEQDKMEISVDSDNRNQIIVFKKGSDLSYRIIKLLCSSHYCVGDALKSIEVNFYNQILLDSMNNDSSLFSISSSVANSWGTMLHLVSTKNVIPLKMFWRKSRWNDFEFDLIADATMNNKVLATENIKINHHGNQSATVSMSLASNGENDIATRVLAKLKNLPLPVLAKFIPSAQLDVSGQISGVLAFESSNNSKKLSADFQCIDGHIQWLNLDDLYRRAMFKNPEEEISNPYLAWKSDFKESKIVMNWSDKGKDIMVDIKSPVKSKRTLFIKIENSLEDYFLNVKFPSLNAKEKKFLSSQLNQVANEFSFPFSLVGKELQLSKLQEKTNTGEDSL